MAVHVFVGRCLHMSIHLPVGMCLHMSIHIFVAMCLHMFVYKSVHIRNLNLRHHIDTALWQF